MKDAKVNFNIDNGSDFFAHEVSVSYNPTLFILDFKSITPRIDARSNEEQVISLRHNIVMIEAYHAKAFAEFLNRRILDYERQFGKIEEPKAIKLAKKKDREQKKAPKAQPESPAYFG